MKMKWFSIAALTVSLAAPAGLMTVQAHAAGVPPAPGLTQDRAWDQAPDDYRDVQREGFHDGVEAARRDWERHSHKDADDHERFRHPPVDRQFARDYRDAFKRGYSEAEHHMRDERPMRDDHRRDDDHPY